MYDKRKKRRITKKAILIFSGIFIAFAVLLTGIIMVATMGKDLEDTIVTLPFKDDASYVYAANNIVYLDGDYIKGISPALTEVWELKLLSSNLDLICSNNTITAYGDGLVQTIDSSGKQLFSAKVTGDIISARVCDSKVAVFVEQTVADETHSYIMSFNMSGNVLYELEVTNRYILDYGFDFDCDLLYVLELDTSGVVPISRISTYRPETKAMTGVKELKDQLVKRIYIIDGTVYALGTNQLIKYSSLGENEKEIIIYGWKLEDFYMESKGEPKFIYIPSNTDDTGIDIVRVIRPNGSETKINLPPDVFKVLHIQDKVYCFTPNNIYVYTSNGNYLRSMQLPYSIDGSERAFDNSVFLTSENTVYMMPLS